MKNVFFLVIFFLIFACSNKKVVYWCGDHACVNKKEKELYFKKNLVVEIRNLNEKNKLNKTEIEKIKKQISKEEKKNKLTKKKLEKMAKIEEKQKIKDEKKRIKQNKKLEKKLLKNNKTEDKKITKIIEEVDPIKSDVVDAKISLTEFESDDFSNLVERITKENSNKPFPDINNLSK